MIGLKGGDGPSGHRPKHTVNRSGIVAIPLQLRLHVHHHLVRRQIVIPVDRTIVLVSVAGIVAPGRVPIPSIPVIWRAEIKGDAWMMTFPPNTIVPFPVI